MEVTIREAAPLLGRSPRAVRARVAQGLLPARRVGRTWMIPLEHLPLTAEQRARMLARAEEARSAVDRVLPSRAAVDRDRRHRSAADLAPFAALRTLLADGGNAGPDWTPVHRRFRAALMALAAAAHEFDRRRRAAFLRRARRLLSHATALLLLRVEDEAARTCCATVEREVLPRIGGLLRWTEREGARGDGR